MSETSVSLPSLSSAVSSEESKLELLLLELLSSDSSMIRAGSSVSAGEGIGSATGSNLVRFLGVSRVRDSAGDLPASAFGFCSRFFCCWFRNPTKLGLGNLPGSWVDFEVSGLVAMEDLREEVGEGSLAILDLTFGGSAPTLGGRTTGLGTSLGPGVEVVLVPLGRFLDLVGSSPSDSSGVAGSNFLKILGNCVRGGSSGFCGLFSNRPAFFYSFSRPGRSSLGTAGSSRVRVRAL